MSTTKQGTKQGVVRRLGASLGKSKAEQQAEDLQGYVTAVGATPISSCTPGEATTLSGVLRSVTLRPRENVPALEAELYDGSALITLVWLGRRRIAGIEHGRQIKVVGRVGVQDRQRVMFNPRYELR